MGRLSLPNRSELSRSDSVLSPRANHLATPGELSQFLIMQTYVFPQIRIPIYH